MADWDADAAAYGAELATRRGAAPPATLGAIWQANWNAAGLDTFTGSGAPLAGAFNDLVDAATAKLGPLPAAAKARARLFRRAGLRRQGGAHRPDGRGPAEGSAG